MCMQDMALSFVYRIPMLRSSVQTLNHKYNQVKCSNIFVNWVLRLMEQCLFLCVQLLSQIQYREYWSHLNNYLYIIVCQYATPVLWSQLTEAYQWSVQLAWEGASAVSKYVDHVMCGLRACESPHTSVNFDTPSVKMMIDFMTRSLAELKLNENNSLLEVNGYENEFHQPGVIVDHSSTICHCDKHDKHHEHTYGNNNNLDTIIAAYKASSSSQHYDAISATSSAADDNIIAASYGRDTDDRQYHPQQSKEQDPEQMEEQTSPVYANNNINNLYAIVATHKAPASSNRDEAIIATSRAADDNNIADLYGMDTQDNQSVEQDPAHIEEQTLSGQEWHRLYPSSQPLIPMMTPDKAFQLAEALREKRQDKTGRDAYEVDTVLVLLSQWDVIDVKSKHYAIDRANLLYLAICYGWSYALQKVSPATSAPIVTPSVTPPPERDHLSLQGQLSNDETLNPHLQTKRLRKTVISRSQGSVYTNDTGKRHPYHHNNNNYFQRPNQYNNYNRQSFPPNRVYHPGPYNSAYFYTK